MTKKTGYVVKIGMLSAVAFVLMYLEFPLPIFPQWLKIDISDVPALLGSFALGPVAGAMIGLVKNALFFVLRNSGTGGIGELANFLLGLILVLPPALMYRRNKNRKTALLGISIGVALTSALGALLNAYIILPMYSTIMPVEAIMGMAKAANPAIDSFMDIALLAVVPFNLIKGALELLVTMLLYKRISPLLHK